MAQDLISKYLLFVDINSRSQAKYQLLMFVRPLEARPQPLSLSRVPVLFLSPKANPFLRQDKLWLLKYLLLRTEQAASVSINRVRVQIQVLMVHLGSLEE